MVSWGLGCFQPRLAWPAQRDTMVIDGLSSPCPGDAARSDVPSDYMLGLPFPDGQKAQLLPGSACLPPLLVEGRSVMIQPRAPGPA